MPIYSLSPGQYHTFLQVFNGLSVNGRIGKNEIRSILARRGVQATNSELQSIIDSVSVESTGLNFQAFVDYVSSYEAFRDSEGEFTDAFRIYDRSGSGQLSRDDIKYVLGKIGVAVDLNQLMDQCDKNKDGFIQYDEFVDLMRKKY